MDYSKFNELYDYDKPTDDQIVDAIKIGNTVVLIDLVTTTPQIRDRYQIHALDRYFPDDNFLIVPDDQAKRIIKDKHVIKIGESDLGIMFMSN
jgi:hypothetical protein